MEQRTAVTLLVDGGPDWSTSSLLNCLFFYRLWRDVGLDVLIVCSYAARCLSYNPIEHLWAPLSKHLSGVQFSAVASGDRKPPCQLSGITAQERKQKEAIVFDNTINELCSVHWANATFDGYPCHSFHIRCLDDKPPIYDDHEDIQSFLRCPLCDIKAGKYKEISLEMKAMLKHFMRYRNEVIIIKCQDTDCSHCRQHPIVAKKLFQFLRERDMKMFAPQPSTDINESHYIVPSWRCVANTKMNCQ